MNNTDQQEQSTDSREPRNARPAGDPLETDPVTANEAADLREGQEGYGWGV